MKLSLLLKQSVGIGMFLMTCLMSGCVDKESVYNPDHDKNKLPPKDEVFDYSTRTEMKLSVNYGLPGFQAIIQVFDAYPLSEDGKTLKEGLTPLFVAYTDKNAKYEGVMNIPTSVKEVYLYTSKWGLPRCVKMEMVNGTATYDDAVSRSLSGRALIDRNKRFSGDRAPYSYKSDLSSNFYSLCTWGDYFKLSEPEDYLIDYKDGAKLSGLSDRSRAYFAEHKGHNFVEASGKTNLVTTQDGTTFDVVMFMEQAEYCNTFGYFYYPKENKPTDMNQVKKYIITPNTAFDSQSFMGDKAGKTMRLKYFGQDGTGVGQDEFPAGYEIAWFYVRAAAGKSDGLINQYGTLDDWALNDDLCTSNKTSDGRFVMMKDGKTGTLVLGFEDSKTVSDNDDFCDVAFFVETNKAVEGPETVIPDDKEEEESVAQPYEGILCFEDQWPDKGDYDLNDVAVQYKREFTLNSDNKYTGAKETFTFVQKNNAATYDNYFAYSLKNPGTMKKESSSEMVVYEDKTQSYVINVSARQNENKTFVIERSFTSPMERNTIDEDFSPYIIVGSYAESTRVEVHLPKQEGTIYQDASKVATGNDVYYTDKTDLLPFAINIAHKGFELSPERVPINETYSRFDSWAKSHGVQDADWYMKK